VSQTVAIPWRHRMVARIRRSENSALLVLSVVIGAFAGLGAVAFRWLIETATLLFSGHDDYSDVGHAAHPSLPWLGPFFIVLAPAVGGLIYGVGSRAS